MSHPHDVYNQSITCCASFFQGALSFIIAVQCRLIIEKMTELINKFLDKVRDILEGLD